MSYPDTRFIEFTYNNKGNIITKRLTDGTNINFTYDSLNRIITKILPDTMYIVIATMLWEECCRLSTIQVLLL
ncbi:MAG: hypothetical protein IPG38_18360 [Chitinophagaceae bacterium]|nr:hypothetical protein [Chitinophagaceae bacterium]